MKLRVGAAVETDSTAAGAAVTAAGIVVEVDPAVVSVTF